MLPKPRLGTQTRLVSRRMKKQVDNAQQTVYEPHQYRERAPLHAGQRYDRVRTERVWVAPTRLGAGYC